MSFKTRISKGAEMVYRGLAGTVVVLMFMSPLALPDPCLASGGSVTVEWGDRKASPQPAPAPQKESTGKGPPDHAPAHGYRAKHQYRYYPDSQVYFDPSRSVYFYIEKGSWRMAASLPSFIGLSSGFVTLGMDSDKPYTHHHEHKAKHPPGKEKDKKGKSSKK
jgi:hypothetical protein